MSRGNGRGCGLVDRRRRGPGLRHALVPLELVEGSMRVPQEEAGSDETEHCNAKPDDDTQVLVIHAKPPAE